MANSVTTIKDSVITKLQGVGALFDVYRYAIDKPTDGRHPFAVVTLDSWEGEFGDTQRNIMRFTISVNIYQERTEAGFGNQKAERVIDEALDEIITAFNMDTTLSGTVKMIRPINGNTEYDDRGLGDTRVAQVILEATVVVDSL